MKDNYVEHLIQAYLDQALTAQQQTEFESLMLQSESARLRFWELAEIHGLAPLAVASIGLKLDDDVSSKSPSTAALQTTTAASSQASAITRQRQLWLALAGGVLLGCIISTFATPLRGMPQQPPPTSMTVENFESGTAPAALGMPGDSDVWSGDYTQVVTAQQGVAPLDGKKMLQILRADYDGKPQPEGSYCGDLYRLIDVRSLRQQLTNEGGVIQASAMFNMSAQAEDEEFRYTIRILALTSDVVAHLQQLDVPMLDDLALAMGRQNLKLDNDPKTWELAQSELRLPPTTDFVLIHLSITYGYAPDAVKRITFPGHFVDDIQVSLSNYAR